MTTSTASPTGGLIGLLRRLHSIEVGGGGRREGETTRIGPARLAELFRLLLMLIENGLSLPKSLGSLAEDRSTRRYRHVLLRLKSVIESGGTLSAGMAKFPRTFTLMQVEQVRIGERSSNLETALSGIAEQLKRQVELRKRIIKKISYPALITLAGGGLMVFMCVVVVPEFETVYGASNVKLPPVTRVVTGASRAVLSYGPLMIPIAIAAVVGLVLARRRPLVARRIDAILLRLPIAGPWLRDVAVLQFAETITSMVSCGYTPVDAVDVAVSCVKNREVRAAAENIRRGVKRGEKLSSQLRSHERFFGATLCQLVAVGEQSGHFADAMRGTCEHLRERLDTRIDASVGLLEPVLTIGLAIAIGGIVLSIYTPMFHMFEVLE